MPRNITVHFSDGTAHQYNNAPDVLTPDDIEKRTKKDYPNKKITRIDGGKKNSGTVQSKDLSQFSIKGLKFGMTVAEVVSVTKATEDDVDAWSRAMDARRKSDPEWWKTSPSMSDYKKPSTSEYDSLKGFSIGGRGGWYPSYKNGKLGAISLTISPTQFEDWFEKLSTNYGKPKNLSANEVGNLMGHRSRNIEVYWDYQDVFVYLDRFSGKLTEGSVAIEWKKWKDEMRKEQESQKAKNKKDF
jgi:hypothetical protein